jgi:hypothetical protein
MFLDLIKDCAFQADGPRSFRPFLPLDDFAPVTKRGPKNTQFYIGLGVSIVGIPRR